MNFYKIMSINTVLALLVLAAFTCDSSSDSDANGTTSADETLDLNTELYTGGHLATLPSSEGTVQGQVVLGDTGGNDGLDLDGDGEADMIYGALTKASGRLESVSFQFDSANYTFSIQNNQLVIADAMGDLVRLTLDLTGVPVITGLEFLSGDPAVTLGTALALAFFNATTGGLADSSSQYKSCYLYADPSYDQCLDFPGAHWATNALVMEYCNAFFGSSPLIKYSPYLCNSPGTSAGYCSYDNDAGIGGSGSGADYEHNFYVYDGDSTFSTAMSSCGGTWVSF